MLIFQIFLNEKCVIKYRQTVFPVLEKSRGYCYSTIASFEEIVFHAFSNAKRGLPGVIPRQNKTVCISRRNHRISRNRPVLPKVDASGCLFVQITACPESHVGSPSQLVSLDAYNSKQMAYA